MNQVLIVEENKVIAKLIKSSLLADSFTAFNVKEADIFIVSDGLEAYETIGKHKGINYLLTEVTVPSINGDELVDILVDTGKIEQVSVVFVTADANRTFMNPNYKRNVLGKIQKPFNSKTFQDALGQLITDRDNWKNRSQNMQQVWEEQGNFLTKVISAYLAKNLPEHKPDGAEIYEISQGFIQTDEELPFDELIYTLPIIIDEYTEKKGLDLAVDEAKLSCLFKKECYLLKRQKPKPVLLPQLRQSLEHLKGKKIGETLTVEKISEFLFANAQKSLDAQLAELATYPMMDYRIMEGFYPIALAKLEALDCRIITADILAQREKLQALNQEFKQLATLTIEPNEPFCVGYKDKGALIETFNKKMSETSQLMLKLLAKNTGLLDTLIWNEAKSSKTIYAYFNSSASFNTLTSYSLASRLLQKGSVPPQYREKFKKIVAYTQKFEDRKIAMISEDFKKVDTITSVLRLGNKYWSFNSFSKLEQFDKWLATNTPDILIYDIEFKIENDKSDGYAVMLNMFKQVQLLEANGAIIFVSDNTASSDKRFTDLIAVNASFDKDTLIERIKRT